MIEVQNLTKRYGPFTAVDDVSFRVEAGEILGFLGPNGAGKTTTMRVLTGYMPATEGTATVAGYDVFSAPIEAKRRTGYLPETPPLYPDMTVREYLTFVGKLFHLGDDIIESRLMKMLDIFGLKDNLDQRMDGFSKGMRQKVLITSGLLHNPQIVIMDEPLSGLDANAVIMVKELLQVLKAEGKTIFYCSHMMDVVEKVSDRIVLIDKGVVVADGTIEELRKESSDSLEKIFSKLTSTDNMTERAGGFASAFRDSIDNSNSGHE